MDTVRFVLRQSTIPYQTSSEWLVYAEVPAAGGDGALIAIYETEQAAKAYADLMNKLADMPGILAQPHRY